MKIVEIIALSEGLPQGGRLYHGTDIMSGARIVYQDAIKANTDHVIWQRGSKDGEYQGQKSPPGVSLTRSFNFAVTWKGGAGVVFELDGSRLRANARLTPVDYYNDRREAEEFLAGSIQPLSGFLTAIYISPETRDYCIEHDEELIAGHKDYEDFLNHPLLKVVKFPGPAPYSNPRNPGKGMFDSSPPQIAVAPAPYSSTASPMVG